MTISTTFLREVKNGPNTYTVAGSPYILENELAHRFIARGWATGTPVGGPRSVTMAQDYKSGTSLYSISQTYSISQPLADLLVSENFGTSAGGTPSLSAVDVEIITEVQAGSLTIAGADADIVTFTVSNTTAGAKTNEKVLLPLPLSPTAVASGQTIKILDMDNGGAVLTNFQIDGLSTDKNSKKRLCFVPVNVPNLGASQHRKLKAVSTSDAAPSGVSISAANVAALAGLANGGVVVTYDINGTVFTSRLDTIMAASSAFSKTAAQLVEAYAGPTRTTWVGSMPPMNAGSPHASGDGLRTYMIIEAWKDATAVVDGGNPITYLTVDVWTENSAVDRPVGAPAHLYYGYKIERMTGLANATLISSDDTDMDGNVIRYDYPRSSPSVTLNLTATDGITTFSRSAGSWPTDIIGAHIVNAGGNGKAIVTARNSATQVAVYVYQGFTASSYTSGQWNIEGIGHQYNSTVPLRRVYAGAKPSHIVGWGNLSSAIAPDNRASMDYLASTKMYLNNQTTFASVTHDMTGVDLMRSSDGSRRPLTFLGPTPVEMGELETEIGQGGWVETIGPVPTWCIDALVKPSAAGRRRLFENAEYWSTWQYLWPRKFGASTTGQAGVWPRSDNGTAYKWDDRFPGTQIILPGGSASNGINNWSIGFFPYTSDTAHHSASCYFAYLMSGNLYWLIHIQRQEAYSGLSTDSTYNGAGVNNTAMGDADGVNSTSFGAGQTRAVAWKTRDLLHAAICTPDGIDEKIVNSKSYLLARIDKTWTAGKAYGPDDVNNTFPSANSMPAYIMANYDRQGFSERANEAIIASWQLSFCDIAMAQAKEFGLNNADLDAIAQWHMRSQVARHDTAGALVFQIISDAYYSVLSFDAQSAPASWDEIYQRSCWLKPMDTQGDVDGAYERTPTGTATLSANTVGSGRTMTFSASFFGQGSWYVGGFVREPSTNGVFQITGVSGNVLTGNVINIFSSATPAIGGLRIPGPHRLDYTGYDDVVAVGNDYPQFAVAAMRLGVDGGLFTTELNTAIAAQLARSGYSEERPAFNIAVRS